MMAERTFGGRFGTGLMGNDEGRARVRIPNEDGEFPTYVGGCKKGVDVICVSHV